MRFSLLILPAGAALLSACTVGPNFERPAAPQTTAYASPAEIAPQPGAPQAALGTGPGARWWTAFGSPELDALVDRALANNHSLQASDATLLAAREDTRALAGKRLPQLDANTRIEQEQVNLSAFGFKPNPALGLSGNPEFQLYSVGGGISYDLDLFGGLRRQVEQSAATAEAEQRRAEAAHLTLAGQVVNQVLSIAAIRARIDTTNAILADDQRNLDLTTKRKDAGEGTLTEVLNAQAQLTADRGLMPPLEQQWAEARHSLAVLVGVAPADLGPVDVSLDGLVFPADVPVTMPSELIHKRPDILQAEADLHAATAAIGIATAHLYPDLTLGANVTQGAPGLDNLLKDAFRGYDIFAGLSAPIFHGGTLKAQREAAVQRAHAADATYRQTVLVAFGQVADLLTAMQNDAKSVSMQRDAVSVAGRSLGLSRRSFQVGNAGILQVLDSERLYQRASSDLVEARAQQLLSIARLYVATAGGWTTAQVASDAR